MNGAVVLLIAVLTLTGAGPVLAERPLWGSLEPGPYGAGFTTIEAYDNSRTARPKFDYFGVPLEGERARPIQVLVWYPAAVAEADVPMTLAEYIFPNPENPDFFPYVTAVQQRDLGLMFMVMGNDGGLVLDVQNVDVGAVRDAAHAEGAFPVLVYFPNIGRSFFDNLVLCELLASHGFVVMTTHSMGAGGVNPEPNQAGLETVVRDGEFGLSLLRGREYVDWNRLATFGLGFGGLASWAFQMRNADVEAVTCLSGWNVIAAQAELAGNGTHFNAERMTVPQLQLFGGDDSTISLSHIDSCRYSLRYLGRVTGAEPVDFSSYGAIRDIISDSGEFAVSVLRPQYYSVCRHVLEFFRQYLGSEETATPFLARAARELPEGTITVSTITAEQKPPTSDEFMAIIQSQGALRAVELYERFKTSAPGTIAFQEANMNAIGYRLLQTGRTSEAVEIFRITAEAFPNSANVWDSYADGCQAVGDTEQAIACYRKVLEVLPTDQAVNDQLRTTLQQNAEQGLERLQSQ